MTGDAGFGAEMEDIGIFKAITLVPLGEKPKSIFFSGKIILSPELFFPKIKDFDSQDFSPGGTGENRSSAPVPVFPCVLLPYPSLSWCNIHPGKEWKGNSWNSSVQAGRGHEILVKDSMEWSPA